MGVSYKTDSCEKKELIRVYPNITLEDIEWALEYYNIGHSHKKIDIRKFELNEDRILNMALRKELNDLKSRMRSLLEDKEESEKYIKQLQNKADADADKIQQYKKDIEDREKTVDTRYRALEERENKIVEREECLRTREKKVRAAEYKVSEAWKKIKEINAKSRYKEEIKDSRSDQNEDKKKVDSSELSIESAYERIREYLSRLGVSNGTVSRSALENKFGKDIIRELILKSYLISIGREVTIGK